MNQPANKPSQSRPPYGRLPTAAELAALHNPRRRPAQKHSPPPMQRKPVPPRRQPAQPQRQPVPPFPARRLPAQRPAVSGTASPVPRARRTPVSSKAPSRTGRHGSRRKILFGIAGIVIIAGGIFTVIKQNTPDEHVQGVNQTQNTEKDQPEGNDETALTPEMLHNHKSSVDVPRLISIPKLNINARILAMGLGANDQPRAPSNIFDTSWQDSSAKAGQPGTMIIQGHIHGPTKPGALYDLKKLTKDDIIKIENGGGLTYTYKVTRTQIYDAQTSNPSEFTTQDAGGASNLILMTYVSGTAQAANRYTERIVVFAALSQ